MNKKRWTDYFIVRLLIAWSAGVAIYTIYTVISLWTH